jgi:carboxysome peptide B
MDIFQVESPLVCTQRAPGLEHMSLRILRDLNGNRMVAVDPVGVRTGNWVFTASGSAARYATGNFNVHTDLTINGIIDSWPEQSDRSGQ